MRVGVPLSAVLHVVAVAGLTPLVLSSTREEATPMMILPVELLEIADTTNMTAASEVVKEEEAPEAPAPAEAAAPPPPPDPEEEVLPAEEPPPPKKQPEKKPEPKKETQDFDSTLQDILKSARNAPAPAPKATTPSAAANEGQQRISVGDRRRMTMTVGDAILQQLIAKGCWHSQADMADARRLRAVIAVRFGRDGHFLAEPRLVDPTREPSNDPPLQVFIQRARNGLAKCNQMGFQVPEQYFQTQPPETIELDFRPCKSGEC